MSSDNFFRHPILSHSRSFFSLEKALPFVLIVFFILSFFQSIEAKAKPNKSTKKYILRARKLFFKGKRSFGKGNYRRALVFFKKAFQAWNNRVFHFNIAVAHARLGDEKSAVEHVFKYLKGASPRERRLPKELEKLIHSYGILHVSTPFLDANHWVDDKKVTSGKVMRVVVPTGVHNVVIRRNGKLFARRALSVVGGQIVHWTVSSDRGGPSVKLNRIHRSVHFTKTNKNKPKLPGRLHWAYFATFSSLAATGFAVGLGFYFKTKSINDRYLDDTSNKTLRSKGILFQNTTNALLGVAACSALTATVLAFFTQWQSPKTKHTVSVSGGPLPGGGVLNISFVDY